MTCRHSQDAAPLPVAFTPSSDSNSTPTYLSLASFTTANPTSTLGPVLWLSCLLRMLSLQTAARFTPLCPPHHLWETPTQFLTTKAVCTRAQEQTCTPLQTAHLTSLLFITLVAINFQPEINRFSHFFHTKSGVGVLVWNANHQLAHVTRSRFTSLHLGFLTCEMEQHCTCFLCTLRSLGVNEVTSRHEPLTTTNSLTTVAPQEKTFKKMV